LFLQPGKAFDSIHDHRAFAIERGEHAGKQQFRFGLFVA
jgi:hypothetical protein